MAEGSDALLDQLDRVVRDEFDAKMLGRVGRGSRKSSFSTEQLRWHEQEMLLQLEWRHTIRHRIGRVAWTHGHSSCDEDTNTWDEGDRRRHSRCSGTAGCGRCVWPSSWWHTTNSNGSTMRRTYQRKTWCMVIQTGQARKHREALPERTEQLWTASHRIQLLDSARCLLSRAERLNCTPQSSRRVAVSTVAGRGRTEAETGGAHRQHGESGLAQPYWFGASAAPGPELVVDPSGSASWAILGQQRERSDDETPH